MDIQKSNYISLLEQIAYYADYIEKIENSSKNSFLYWANFGTGDCWRLSISHRKMSISRSVAQRPFSARVASRLLVQQHSHAHTSDGTQKARLAVASCKMKVSIILIVFKFKSSVILKLPFNMFVIAYWLHVFALWITCFLSKTRMLPLRYYEGAMFAWKEAYGILEVYNEAGDSLVLFS